MENSTYDITKDTMKVNENLQWFTVILLSVLSYFKGTSYLIVLIFWVINILIVGNARRIHSKTGLGLGMLLRRSLYLIPLLFPALFGFEFMLTPVRMNIPALILIGLTVGALSVAPKYKDWQLLLSYDMIDYFQKKKSKFSYCTMLLLYILAPLCEEYFFRNFIISRTMDTIGPFAIILSAFLFFLHHFGVKWSSKFKKYDFIIQIIFGLISGVMFYFSESIIPCIIAHLTYNAPHIILSARCYHHFYHHEDKVA